MGVNEAFLYFKDAHKSQFYKDGTPYWTHIHRVGTFLQEVLKNVLDEETRDTVVIAGYGHDALEDTDVTEEEIEKRFGPQVLAFIKDLTNTIGDHDVSAYVEQIANAPELSRIIKLADMIDNYRSIAHRVHDNGPEFFREKVFPIMEPMYERIITIPFTQYPVGNELIEQVKHARVLALRAVEEA